ncbi:MAG: serine/threonine-protein kinase [Polyangiaceae bacterium]
MTEASDSIPGSMRRSAPPIAAGAVLGEKYEIIGVLGEGGTGIVYEAKRVKEGDVVALKVIHPHLLGDAQIRGRFLREVAILRRLQGKYLCPIIDSGEVPDPKREEASLLYMALPKIEGKALDRVIAEDGTPSVERTLEIVSQICAALASAHAQGVIHRDLKPANVILRGRLVNHETRAPEGRADCQVTVVDFGMAKIVTGVGGTGTTALTQHNMIFGTPEYMAPEQARGDELDARCDVYAVGVMLYEMLTGAVPFRAPTPLGVLTAHLTSTPTAPRKRVPDRNISAALEAVVLHAIAKSPADRYATANALMTAIAHARITPDDPASVEPQAVISLEGESADGHALTMPAPNPTSVPPKSVKVTASVRPAIAAPPSDEVFSQRTRRRSAVVWVLAAAIGIAVGVYLSLHS